MVTVNNVYSKLSVDLSIGNIFDVNIYKMMIT